MFFTSLNNKDVKIEIASLSISAKKKAAEIVFGELAKHYEEVKE